MFPPLLNLIYFVFLLAVLPVILYRRLILGKYREGLSDRFWGAVPAMPEKRGKRIWFQAVSVGEVNLLKPVIKKIAAVHPDWEICVSSTSQTGYELARRLFDGFCVFRCPLDFSWSVRRALRRIEPDMLVLAELELWPNLILAAHRSGSKVVFINGRISGASFPRYRRIRFFLRRLFRAVDFAACGSEETFERFGQLGLPKEKRLITGSIKFDGTETNRENPKTVSLAQLAGITPDDLVFLAGSTQEPEEELAVGTYRALLEEFPRLRLILVPRHPERFDAVAEMLDRSGLLWIRRSRLTGDRKESEGRILLVDTVGELGAWWGTAKIAFVGGSMGTRGGQNMLEPAGYGAAVSFGPNTKNFREISERMLRADAARVVRNGEELTDFVRRVLSERDFAQKLGENARNLVMAQRGAADATVKILEEQMS